MNIQKIAHVFAPLLLACMCCVAAHGQQQRVEGIVLDQFRAPVAGAKVFLKAQTFVVAETVTDTGGRFAFNSPPLDGELLIVVEAEGFARIERRWAAAGVEQGAASELVLNPAGVSGEVVVTAARTETRLGETAASVVSLSETELAATAALTLDDALRQVPGFQLFRRSGSRTANPTAQGVSLRG
ncbi:MAG: carboxypeptidase regulatory-like domain-containing protein, partial [Acidobacteriota bacterium]|nr:carboxypeptidase regulatory-like domain-containing protein [Acidobacteriota bacterium]